jgi:hypothetical protein
VVGIDGDSDVEEPMSTSWDKDFIVHQDLLERCRSFMGDDMPQATPVPSKKRIFSSFCEPPEEERVADYIPIGLLVRESMKSSQSNFFGHTSLDFDESATRIKNLDLSPLLAMTARCRPLHDLSLSQ